MDPSECYKIWRYICKHFDVQENEEDEILKITKDDLESVVECLMLPNMSTDKIMIVTKFLQNVSILDYLSQRV